MARFATSVAVGLAVVFTISYVVEEALVAVGVGRGEAELASLLLVVGLIYAARNRISDDPWTLANPVAGGAVTAVVVSVCLTAWFLLTEPDDDVALAASGLGCLVGAACGVGCALRWRRKGGGAG